MRKAKGKNWKSQSKNKENEYKEKCVVRQQRTQERWEKSGENN